MPVVLFLIFLFPSLSAGTDKQQFCNAYADRAVQQYQQGMSHHLEGIVPPVWSNDRNGHYLWCMGMPENTVSSETSKRQAYLDRFIGQKKQTDTKNTSPAFAEILGTMLPAVTTITALTGTDSYLGCYTDSKNRDLAGFTFSSPKMTPKLCQDTCRQRGFSYAGVQYYRQCFCGNSYGKLGKSNKCNTPCAGNSKEICGGSWANSVYDTSFIGCYRDSKTRDLAGFRFSSPRMTKKLCMDSCRKKGFQYAGLQYSNQCFCGNSYGKLGKSNNCNMPCSGNSQEICGGNWANSVYQVQNSTTWNLLTITGIKCVKPAGGVDGWISDGLDALKYIGQAAGTLGGVVGLPTLSMVAKYASQGSAEAQKAINLLNGKYSGQDDLIVQVNGKQVLPVSGTYQAIKGGQTINPNIKVSFRNNVRISLIEYDSGSDNDDLGNVTIDSSKMKINESRTWKDLIVTAPSSEDGSIYLVTARVDKGKGNSSSVPKWVKCGTAQCIACTQEQCAEHRRDGLDRDGDTEDLKACPPGYKDFGYQKYPQTWPAEDVYLRICKLVEM